MIKFGCGIRKVQNFFFVLTIVLIVAMVSIYFLNPVVADFVNTIIYSNSVLKLNEWILGNYIYAILPLVVGSFLLSIIIRWIIHPITCNAKEGFYCCFGSEFLSYTWTVLIVGVLGAAAFVYTKTLGFDKILESAINALTSGVYNEKQIYVVYCLGLAVVVLVVLIIITIVHSNKMKNKELYL